MNRSRLIKETSLRTGYTQIVCGEIINEVIQIITAELEAYGSVHLPNFGVFDVYDKKPTVVRIPGSNEITEIEGKKYPRFMPAQQLKDRVGS